MATRKRRARPGAAIADPTIRQALDAYVAAQPAKRRRAARLDLELLESYLNGYAYESLTNAESRLFEELSNEQGAGHRYYCEIFGPKKLVPELRQFFGWFLIHKVMARPEDLGRVAKETGRLVTWLGERASIPATAAKEGAALAAEAEVVVPRAEEVAHMLRPALGAEREPTGEVIEGQFRVARLKAGKLWLESWEDGETYGPLAIPAAATKGLAVDWEISGAVGQVGREWVLLEVWNVEPGIG
ncbi:MAG: hypothetical protein ACE5HT_08880 [Gemmatimonadales bacterium]